MAVTWPAMAEPCSCGGGLICAGATGIVVDRVADVVPLAPAQIKPPPQLHGSAMAGHVTAIGALNERMLIVLDMDSLLAGLGMHATGELAA